MTVALKLFGTPQVRLKKRWETLPFDKTSAVLCYVAAHPQGVTRGTLATLLWETDDHRARANLRQLLMRVRRSSWSLALQVTDDHVVWHGSTDLESFWKALKNNLALEPFAPEFLAGFLISDAPALMDWLDLERQTLRHAWREAALQRAAVLQNLAALELLRLVLETDALCEDAVQAILRLSIRLEQPEMGRLAFETFEQFLQQELGLEPLPETVLLYQQGQTRQTPRLEPRQTLPAPSTAFIGRDAELSALEALLESGSRCIAVIASGGMGKTRLALRTAQAWQDSFADGVVFASMLGLHGQAALSDALLQGFAVPNRQADTVSQLLSLLEKKSALLVLDNLESDPEAASLLIARLLEACPKLRVLLTSRERLGLSGETVLELGGLEPLAAQSLFIAAARRADSRLRLDSDGQAVVARIALHCGYMPLALELAASWAAVLDLADLEHQVLTGLQHLESRFRDTPERHKSIRAVFMQTWLRLEPNLCQILAWLAPLEGGFTLPMAQGIAKASLRDLETLIARSLLSRQGQRYAIHELLRQFILEQPQAQSMVAQTWLLEFTQALQTSRRSARTLAQLEDELANIRCALWDFLEARNDLAVRVLYLALDDVYDTRGLSLEAKQVFARVLQKLEPTSHLRAELFKLEASYTMRLGDTTQAERLFTLSLSCALEPSLKASVLNLLAQLMSRSGRWLESDAAFIESIALYQSVPNIEQARLAECYNGLGVNAKLRGEFSQSQQYLEAAIVLNQAVGHLEGVAIATLNLANVHEAQGQDMAAKTAYELCFKHFTALGHKRAIAVVFNNLSIVQRKLGDILGARVSLEQSLTLKREMHDKRGIAVALQSLAEIEMLEAKPQQARGHLLESIEIALEASAMPTVMQSFHAFAGALELEGQLARAALIWRAVVVHPATSGEIQREIALKLPSLPKSGKTPEFQELLASLQPS